MSRIMDETLEERKLRHLEAIRMISKAHACLLMGKTPEFGDIETTENTVKGTVAGKWRLSIELIEKVKVKVRPKFRVV